MATYDYDLFVIGGGSGGVRAARVAAQHGARVAIAEEYRYGGTCVIRGCIPKKLFVYAAHYRYDFKDARGYGWTVRDVDFSWARLVEAKDKEIDRLNRIYIGLLENNDVEVIHARATLADAHTIDMDGRRVTAETILVATGAHPFMPDIPGAELAISSNEAFHLTALPRRLCVVGGGYIALEFAHIFRGLGCEVTMVHRRDLMLRGFDYDVRLAATDALSRHGIELHMGEEVRAIHEHGDAQRVELDNDMSFETDAIMFATGRHPNTDGLGLDRAGADTGPLGAVVVDDYSKTTADNIYAVGDCTNRVNLTPVAIREGQAFADTVFGGAPTSVDYHCIPTAVFAVPEVASVGMTEEVARQKCDRVDVYKTHFRPLKHTLSGRDDKVLLKLLVDAGDERVVGAHMVGDGASEVIQTLAIAVHMKATKSDLDATVALHPTTAEELVLMREVYRPE